MTQHTTLTYSIADLLAAMQRLRDPQMGCPWDLEQTSQSLLPYLLEESYELIDAVEAQDSAHICEELGDVLLQVIFHSQLAAEQNVFNFSDVVATLTAKLIRRHPHVFTDAVERLDSHTVEQNWQAIKQQERGVQKHQDLFENTPKALPALMRAQKIQKRAAQVGFDFSDPQQVLAQLKSEVAELEQAMQQADSAAMQDELGDVLFSCANLARHLQLQSEDCLRQANTKFMCRMRFIEQQLSAQCSTWQTLDDSTKEYLWHSAKMHN